MAITFPTTLDGAGTFPSGILDADVQLTTHPTLHNNVDLALLALEAKVGIDGSAVTTSLDYIAKSAPGKVLLTTTGDMIYASSANTPARLALTAPAANILNVVGVANGETVPSYKSIFDGTTPAANADAGSAGTSLIAAHRDHVHATSSYILKSVMTTTGDIIYASAASTPARLAVGGAATVLGVSGGLPSWQPQSYLDHGSIGGLGDDDHTQYALLAGRSGGQTLIGGTAASDGLALTATSNGTNSGTVTITGRTSLAGTLTGNIGFNVGQTVSNDTVNSFGMYMGGCTLQLPASGNGYMFYSGGTINVASGAATACYSGYLEAQAKTGGGTVTTAVGLRINKPTIGATNNVYFQFDTADATAAGAYHGRIAVMYNSLIKYIHIFSA